MDKEEARFILRCFRPGGSDAADPEFAEALQLAAADRDLGEWLAKERALDADFSEVLGTLPLPDGLREEILAGLAAERGDLPQADKIDASFIGALATVKPPEGMRDEILAAMEQSAPKAGSRRGSSWWRFGVPLAAAAGIALALVIQSEQPPTGDSSVDSGLENGGSAVPVSFVQSEAIAALESPEFALDLKNPDHDTLFEFIHKSGRACPSGCIPEGLEKIPGLGCRVIEIDGKPGAIICFKRGENEVVHLVVFRRKDVSGSLPSDGRPQFEQSGDWAVASWEQDNRAFVLLGQTSAEHLGELF
ncbi:hypothetical protein [Haloferula sp.]|uniref:hypothetical protein n=1 Tax=Haloferula sp. TaxID=2497595 RepID=UPI003C769170